MVVRSLLRGAAGSYLGSTWARPPRLGGWVPAAQALPRPSHFRGAKFQSLWSFHTTFQGPAKV